MSAVIIVVVFMVAFSKASVVPAGLQNAVESTVEFIRNGIVMEVMGPAGLPFLPFLTALFVFIWVNNIFGIIPGSTSPRRRAWRSPRSSRSSCGSCSTWSGSSSRVGGTT